uniref:Lipoprotein n=1 Tax=Anguilla anguilla TaxID=7936 RepID=A0A0E9VNI3_ANGAN
MKYRCSVELQIVFSFLSGCRKSRG